MKRAFLIDGASQICRAYYSPGPDLRAPGTGEGTKAVFIFLRMLFKLVREQKPDYLVMVTDPPREQSRRRLFYSEYKANRKDDAARREIRKQTKVIKQLVRLMGVPVIQSDVDEADDVLACLTRRFEAKGREVVIVGRDKDLMQLLNSNVSMYDAITNDFVMPLMVETKFGVSPNRLRDFLALVGDGVDNIPGVPTVGPVRALEWLRVVPGGVKTMFDSEVILPASITRVLDRKHGDKSGWDLLLLSWKLAKLNFKAEYEAPGMAGMRFRGLQVKSDPVRIIFQRLGFRHLLALGTGGN